MGFWNHPLITFVFISYLEISTFSTHCTNSTQKSPHLKNHKESTYTDGAYRKEMFKACCTRGCIVQNNNDINIYTQFGDKLPKILETNLSIRIEEIKINI